MKGLIYTELIDFVQDQFGIIIGQKMIQDAELQHEGAFTAVGQYEDQDLYSMVQTLSQLTEKPVPVLLKAYGHHLFGVLLKWHPEFLAGVDNAFDALSMVNDSVHVSVKRLYPDSKLPKFDTVRKKNQLMMDYASDRGLGDLAEGLIQGCIDFYGQPMSLTREALSQDGVSAVRFTMVRGD